MPKKKNTNISKWQERLPQLKILADYGLTPIEIAKIYGENPGGTERAMQRYGIKRKKKTSDTNMYDSLSQKEQDKLKEAIAIDYKIKSTNLAKQRKRKPFKTIIACADHHVPSHNIPVNKAMLYLMEDIKPDGVYIIGDYMDMEPISHWLQDKGKRRTLENKRMQHDYIAGNALLDEIDRRLPKGADKRFWWGNHERFYTDLIEKIPALENMLNPTIELKLKERGYTVYEDINHIERIGRLSICHGMYATTNYVKKHIDEFKTNVLFAHIHSPRMEFACSPAREIAIAGYCIGTMGNLNPQFMQNRPNKWQHGFAVIHFFDDGFFDVQMIRLVKARFVYNNKLYDGNV